MGQLGQVGLVGERMRMVLGCLSLILWSGVAIAQTPRADATLRVTVVDPSGAVIVGAQVRVAGSTLDTGLRRRGVRRAGARALHDPRRVAGVRAR